MRAAWAAVALVGFLLLCGVVDLSPAIAQAPPYIGPPQAPPHKPRPKTTSESIAQGKTLFEGACAVCHGVDGSGGTGPNIRGVATRLGSERLFATISQGIWQAGMPAFHSLGDDKIWQIVDYVSSFRRAASPTALGDPRKGEQIYAAMRCSTCHSIAGHGGNSGPDLTKIGSRRVPAFLRGVLLDPGANLPVGTPALPERASYPAYVMYRVVLDNGTEITGTRVNEDSFTLQLRDAQGRIHSIQKLEARSIEVEKGKSFMPSYKEKLSDAQLNDLVAYLSRLGNTP